MSQMTKRALVASLKDLLAEKPLDKITVTDLTEHCGVNRMTFYYHFKDIYDLVEWACIESATRALAGQKTYDTWQQGFLQILQAVQKDKVFVTKVYHSISREHIENYLYRLTYDLMFGVVEEKAAGMTVRPEDKEFIANFYKYAFVGLTLEWVRTGMKDDPAALVERVDPFFHFGFGKLPGTGAVAAAAAQPRHPQAVVDIDLVINADDSLRREQVVAFIVVAVYVDDRHRGHGG